jgi:hypothetical protein
MWAGLFHVYGQTDGHDKAKSLFSQFCEERLKNEIVVFIIITSIQPLGLFWQEPEPSLCDRYGSDTLHF